MRMLLLAVPLLLPGGISAPPPQPANLAVQPFPVIGFFEGRTEGEGVLKVALSAPKAVSVRGRGDVATDGTLVLVQDIREGEKPVRTRTWRIREVSPNHYAGTLTDASGPVTGEVTGNRLHLSYRMKSGLDVEQDLTLAPGGRSAHNRMAVRKFGITIARLDETIRKRD